MSPSVYIKHPRVYPNYNIACIRCGSYSIRKSGYDRKGMQKWKCKICGRDFQEVRTFGKGVKHRHQDHKLVLPMDAIIKEYMVDGKPAKEIAREYKRAPSTIMRYLKDSGVKIRGRFEYGKTPHMKERRRKIGQDVADNRNYRHSPEALAKMSAARKIMWADPDFQYRISKAHKRYWSNEDNKIKQLNVMMAGCSTTKPNKPETALLKLLNEYYADYELEYVGNYKFSLDGLYPDFKSEKYKLIIELFGDYWHRGDDGNKKDRIETYALYGYRTLIVWQSELKDTDSVVKKVRDFVDLVVVR